LVLSTIIISTVLSGRTLSVHRIRSPSICRTFSQLTSLPFATLGNAAVMSMRRTPGMWPLSQAAWALSTTITTASMADLLFLLRNSPSLSWTLCSASADDHSATSFSTTCHVQRSRDMERYAFSFV
jgi:hypothetical protein